MKFSQYVPIAGIVLGGLLLEGCGPQVIATVPLETYVKSYRPIFKESMGKEGFTYHGTVLLTPNSSELELSQILTLHTVGGRDAEKRARTILALDFQPFGLPHFKGTKEAVPATGKCKPYEFTVEGGVQEIELCIMPGYDGAFVEVYDRQSSNQ